MTIPKNILEIGKSRNVSLAYGYWYNSKCSDWFLENPNSSAGILIMSNGVTSYHNYQSTNEMRKDLAESGYVNIC